MRLFDVFSIRKQNTPPTAVFPVYNYSSLLSSLPKEARLACSAQIEVDKQMIASLYQKRKAEVEMGLRVPFPEMRAVEAELQLLRDEWVTNQVQLLPLKERLQQRMVKPEVVLFSDLLKPIVEKKCAEEYLSWLREQEKRDSFGFNPLANTSASYIPAARK